MLVEGEKDVETLREWGLTATTNAGGAKCWSESFDKELAGADILICGDNDDSSRQRTLMRGAGLFGKAKSVRVLDLAIHWKEMPETLGLPASHVMRVMLALRLQQEPQGDMLVLVEGRAL